MVEPNLTWWFRPQRSRRAPVDAPWPHYRLPLDFVARLAFAACRGRPRSAWRDAMELTERMRPVPAVDGVAHVPRTVPCVILPNHYERPGGAWVGWGVIVITAALSRRRPTTSAMRWVMAATWGDCRLGPLRIPAARLRWIGERLAAMYGVILMPAVDANPIARAIALRRLFAALADPGGAAVGLHPEAGGTEALITPPPGVGRFLADLDRRGVPCIPTGVGEQDGRLTVRFGPALPAGRLAGLGDAAAADVVMQAIARLVPPDLRGAYADRLDAIARPTPQSDRD
ncbi:MAG TPA: hypothetical protein VFQ80_01045 [Thermomicrobiales bacterium]|nr:hypothetical protein [Thermomicrobiales bacterium]